MDADPNTGGVRSRRGPVPSLGHAQRRIAQGFRFLTVMAETRMIRAGATEVLTALRGPAASQR